MNQRMRLLALAGSSALLLLLTDACSSEPEEMDNGGGACTVPGATQACLCMGTGQMGTQACTAGTWSACQCAPPVTPGDALPCDVQTIVQNKCWDCHGDVEIAGAPKLKTPSAFRVPSKKPGMTIAQYAGIRVADGTQRMPPAPAAPLSAAEIQVIQNWVNQGAPAGQACVNPPMGTGGAPNTGGVGPISTGGIPPIGGAGGGPATGSGGMTPGSGGSGDGGMGGSGGAPTGNPNEQVTCYKVTARANASGAKYAVPTTPDYYNCFKWAKPWGNKKVHIVRTKPLIDNAAVIHHWILYAGAANGADGSNSKCGGAHSNAAFIAGWAPGGREEVMPLDVGMIVDGAQFDLEAHYNNGKGAGQTDQSGVELCVTEQLRPKEAAVHWLGTQTLNKLEAVGTCAPNLPGPVTILSASPHMHVQGKHMKTVINRRGGGQDILLDQDFDFNTQISYPTPAVINPGDTLTTTCSYKQPTPFGQGTNQEMCYNFITAYPVGTLVGPLNGAIRKNDCTSL